MADLIYLAVIFLILALVFFIMGMRGIAGFTMEIAKFIQYSLVLISKIISASITINTVSSVIFAIIILIALTPICICLCEILLIRGVQKNL